MCCGPTTARTSWIWTTASPDRPCRTCGCSSQASARSGAVQLQQLLRGYSQFFDFDYRELHLIEALRTLRMINYTAWLARRWADPAFPMAFPWFEQTKYWEEHVLALKEQAAALEEPVLEVI